MIELKTSIKQVDQIIHIADIHIRNLKRHKEHKELIKKFVIDVKKIVKQNPNTIVYIGGDVAHTKTDMSPELIEMISFLFNSLITVTDVLLIAGNHDANLNNSSRLDALSPIVDLINRYNKNLHYLKKSDVYRFADTDFAVFSVLDGKKIISANECTAKNKIALYHGPTIKSVLDNGMVLNSGVNIELFDGYDMALLGDIHKKNIIQEYSIDENGKIKPTVAFCGSFLQNNFGEDYYNHGYFLWNVKTKIPEFVKIPNDYGYFTLKLQEPKLPENLFLSKYTQLRLQVSNDFKSSDLVQLKTELKSKFGINDIILEKFDNRLNVLENKVSGGDVIGNIYDVNYQNQLIQNYLNHTNNFISEEDFKLIFEINKNLNNLIKQRDLSNKTLYKLRYLKFSNLFSYGEDNFIDFTKLSGIVGLFTKNKTGKSNLINILIFVLGSKNLKTGKAIDVLNINKNHFYAELCFENSAGKQYFIRRLGKRLKGADGKDNTKVLVDFWTLNDSGGIDSLNGDQKRSTDENIQDFVGSAENLILTSISLQNNFNGLIDKSQSERKQILSSFLGINIFEELYNLANERNKELSILIKEFSKRNYDEDLTNIETNLSKNEKSLDIIIQKITSLEFEKTNKTNELIELTKQLIKIEQTDIDINIIKENKEKIKTEINNILNIIEETKIKLDKIIDTAKQLADQFKKYNEKQLNDEIKKINNYEEQKQTAKELFKNLNLEIKHQEQKLEKLKTLEYDPKCEFCMNNVFVKDAIETKKIYAENLIKFKKIDTQINKLDKLINDNSKFKKDFEKLEDIKKAKESLKILYNKLILEQSIQIERQNFQNKLLDDIEKEIDFYYKNQDDIESNKEKQKKIDSIENALLILKNKLETLTNDEKTFHSEIRLLKSQKNDILKAINEVQQYENEYKLYDFYLSAIHRNSIPYELIKQIIPIFELEINNVLSSVADFSILVNLDSIHIDFYIVYGEKYWPLELTCGMELFLSSLAIRIALMRISNVPRSNFLIIDEGWSVLDSDNMMQLEGFFEQIKSLFDFTIIVSHIEAMKDMIDSTISLETERGFSKVIYN